MTIFQHLVPPRSTEKALQDDLATQRARHPRRPMSVVADSGAPYYLALLKANRILEQLYRRVAIPKAVLTELFDPNAPL